MVVRPVFRAGSGGGLMGPPYDATLPWDEPDPDEEEEREAEEADRWYDERGDDE